MADGISFTFDTVGFDRFIADRMIRIPRAAGQVAVEVGRICEQAAKAKTPVWHGPPTAGGAVSGLLRDSIAVRAAGVATVRVGPVGPRAHLYAAKEEARAHFMEAGRAAAEAAAPLVGEREFGKVWTE